MSTQPTEIILEPGRSEAHYWRDLWRYRELFYFLAWRDVLVRYKQTVIGVAWAVIRPLLTMVIFVVVFGRVAKLPSEGFPYPLLVLSGMLPWQFFANALSESSSSLLTNANLITKIYFPRVILPASSVIVALFDFFITLALLFIMMVWFRYPPTWRLLTIPLFTALALVAAMGPGLLLTALTVKYRDFRYIVPFIVQFGLYISPVGFSSSVVGEKLGEGVRLIYSINPVVGVIDGFRWAIGGQAELHPISFPLSVAFSFIILWLGVHYFRATERSFADVI